VTSEILPLLLDSTKDAIGWWSLLQKEGPVDPSTPWQRWMIVRTGLALVLRSRSRKEPPKGELPSETPIPIESFKKTLHGRRRGRAECVNVIGSFFPGQLLFEGWWEGGLWDATIEAQARRPANSHRSVQNWLYSGFKNWAPSWDLAADASDNTDYTIAQVGKGDEADSLPLVIGAQKAAQARAALDSDLTMTAEIRGRLYHRDDIEEHFGGLPRAALNRLRKAGAMFKYFIMVDDDDDQAWIRRCGSPDIYSGYLWQCWVRETDRDIALAGEVPLDSTFFIWEHTNFADVESIKYNHAALVFKKNYFERRFGLGKMVLLQHSFPVHHLVGAQPETPLLPGKRFKELLGRARDSILTS